MAQGVGPAVISARASVWQLAGLRRTQRSWLAARRAQALVRDAGRRRDDGADPGGRPRLADHGTQFVAATARRVRRTARHDCDVLVVVGVAMRRRADVARRGHATRVCAAAHGTIGEADDSFAGDRLRTQECRTLIAAASGASAMLLLPARTTPQCGEVPSPMAQYSHGTKRHERCRYAG
jgi:hypothetical protein